MYSIVPSRRFEKSLLRLKRSGKLSVAVQSDLQEVFDLLARRASMPVSYADHQLHGEYRQYRECHIKGDLLLMYRIDAERGIVELSDIGSHSQLFG